MLTFSEMKEIVADKINYFVTELQESGYTVASLRKDNSLVAIGEKTGVVTCNIRTIPFVRKTDTGEELWFNIGRHMLNSIDYLILVSVDTPRGFYVIPGSILIAYQEQFFSEGDTYSFHLDFTNESVWGKINYDFTGLHKLLGLAA